MTKLSHWQSPNPVLAAIKQFAAALHRHAYGRIALIFLALLLPFSLARLGLYLYYREDFQGLGLAEILSAFAVGLRFDMSIAVMGVFLPLLLMLLPFRWSHHARWQRLWGWVTYITLLVMAFMLVADLIYFGVVHRHVGSEIGAVSSDIAPMVALAFSQYGVLLLIFVLSGMFGALLWRRLLHPLPTVPAHILPRLFGITVVFMLFLVVGRGGISGKPVSVGDAFFSNSVAQGYLALNGAFAIAHALYDDAPAPREFMPQAEATSRTQRMVAGSGLPFTHPDYPIYQPAKFKGHGSRPNVIVLMLESWGALHVDATRRAMHLPPLGVTPNFDRLAEQGRLYTRFYANGQRSIQGTEAILAGLPSLPGMPYLGEGLEQNRQSFLGEMAQTQGYATYFLQSSDRGSFRFDSISARSGFSTYKGAQDIPELHAAPKPPSTWGTWDHNTLQEASRLFAASRKPFLGYIFTSTTHTPWIIPDARWSKYADDSDRNKFLNSLYYADWALGELIAAAKKSGYYNNTVFVLTADHADDFVEHPEYTPNLYHIPLLLVGPGVKPGIDERIGSQFDIAPTIAELCNWETDYAGLGRSLLEENGKQNRVSFSVRGDVFDMISVRGWVSHNLARRLGQAPDMSTEALDEMEQDLLAEYQTASKLLLANRILPLNPDSHSGK